MRFDRTARRFPGLEIVRGKGGRIYHIHGLPVPHYESRNVEIRFENWSYTPLIFADGPDSPHRWQDGSLCIWHPKAPPEERWIFEDGLLVLLNLTQAHLFREAWWRETGEWLGPEAPHDTPKEPVIEARERDEHAASRRVAAG